MPKYNVRARLGLCLILLLMVAGCSGLSGAPKATVLYDHSYNFSDVRKISIAPIARDSVSTVMVTDAQISRINEALSDELKRRGFEVVTVSGDADIFLSWQLVLQESAYVTAPDGTTQKAIQGTLFVNMIDPIMLKSVWRASFESGLRANPESDAAAQYRKQAAEVILAQFPPDAAVR